ncbi:MAG: UvrD-helicase domain-containing protein [Burkholderiales bacterium]|jgi:DNA helicase-2/ATP-dependent DNA helicase PcrA|nr:UvrD-helicase domain-containing protein [Burkholderiales bacterium]
MNSSTNTILDALNAEQRAAVTLPQGSALILAGAGSGKTRVLTSRIAWLLANGQASPMSVLAVTFTNKAAREMLTRLSVLTPVHTRGMWIGTFHGLCNRMLRAHHRDANLPALFQIMDTADQLALIKRLYRAHQIDDERFPPKALQWFIQGAKEEGLRPNAVEASHEHARRMVEHYALYEAQCQREGVVDFGELLLRSYELLETRPALRDHYRQRFTHLFVDEFQDTNVLQYRWLQLLAGPEASVFAVGDDDQSIYAFRGANVGNMQRFERDLARPGQPVHIVKLEQNYRSHGHILDAANALIRHNRARMGKNLWTEAPHGERLSVFVAGTDYEEAQFVADTAREQSEQGVPLSDIAVLYRSNAQSRALEHALFSAGLPYRVYGGLRFFERAEIKHALAYLRLIASPNDDGALLRVINFPPRGIGARTLEQLQGSARTQGISLWQAACSGAVGGKANTHVAAFVHLIEKCRSETASLLLPEIIEQMLETSGLTAHYRLERESEERLQNLDELIAAARLFLEERDTGAESPPLQFASPLPAPFSKGVAAEGGRGFAAGEGENDHAPLQGENVPSPSRGGLGRGWVSEDEVLAPPSPPTPLPQGERSANDLPPLQEPAPEEILIGGEGWGGDGVSPTTDNSLVTLTAFLTHAALEAGDTQADEGRPALQLMTMHAAKGLEFHTVFITGIEEGLFPHENSLQEANGLEEERRLMYVAITRARRRLYLTYAQTRRLHGQSRYNLPSRFLNELPDELMQWLSPSPLRETQTRFRQTFDDNEDSVSSHTSTRSRSRVTTTSTTTRGTSTVPRVNSPKPMPSIHTRAGNFQIGQSVHHAKFGAGMIIDAEGGGNDARVQVNFRDHGEKWLSLAHTTLDAL